MSAPVAWLNGELIPWADAAVPAWDLGVVAGAAVTEAGRTYGHRFLYQDAHLQRFLDSLQQLRFPQPWSLQQLEEGLDAVLRHNAGLLADTDDLGVVICSTAGSNATYLGRHSDACTTLIHSYPLPFGLWKPAFTVGVRLRIVSTRQIPADCFPVSVKVRNRLHWWLADREAGELEPGSRALVLDQAGNVTETSTSAILLVRDGKLSTPAGAVLNSLSVQLIERHAGELGIPFERREISAAELQRADEIFLSSAPAGLLPVLAVDGRRIRGEGTLQGPVFCQLLESISRETGVDLRARMLQG